MAIWSQGSQDLLHVCDEGFGPTTLTTNQIFRRLHILEASDFGDEKYYKNWSLITSLICVWKNVTK